VRRQALRILVLLAVGFLLICVAIVRFVEHESYLQDAAAEGLNTVQSGGETSGYNIRR